MNTTLIYALIVIGIIALLAALVGKKHGSKLTESRWPYHAIKVLSKPEQVLFFRLLEALPEYVVLAQVGLSRVLQVDKGAGSGKWFNVISRKSLDFVICAKDFTVIAAIELDDATHKQQDRMKADFDKDKALSSAGIKLIRWKVNQIPVTREIQEAVIQKCTE
jgi:hypothetical protein